jgi:hypothetical protein
LAAPSCLAIWPAAEPTAPAAPEMKTVSPSLTAAIRVSPTYAVRPGMPRVPRYADAGTCETSTLRASRSDSRACVRQPAWCSTVSPTCSLSEPDAITSPTAPPSITASSANGGT